LRWVIPHYAEICLPSKAATRGRCAAFSLEVSVGMHGFKA